MKKDNRVKFALTLRSDEALAFYNEQVNSRKRLSTLVFNDILDLGLYFNKLGIELNDTNKAGGMPAQIIGLLLKSMLSNNYSELPESIRLELIRTLAAHLGLSEEATARTLTGVSASANINTSAAVQHKKETVQHQETQESGNTLKKPHVPSLDWLSAPR